MWHNTIVPFLVENPSMAIFLTLCLGYLVGKLKYKMLTLEHCHERIARGRGSRHSGAGSKDTASAQNGFLPAVSVCYRL